MPTPLMPPTPAAIIRSTQKDDEFIAGRLTKELDELFQRTFGLRRWIEQRDRLQLLGKLLYFSATTLSGIQTLGEEHTLLLMVHGGHVPSFLRRLLVVLAHCGSSMLVQKSLNQLLQALDTPDRELWPAALNRAEVRSRLYEHIPAVKAAIANLLKANEALFYIHGAYFALSKRLFGVKYAALDPWSGDGTSKWLYKFLGYLSLFQLTFSLATQLYARRLTADDERSEQTTSEPTDADAGQSDVQSDQLKCSFCLLRIQHPTCTPCGHIFCWKCIFKWLQSKHECPICRQRVEPSRMVFLQNI